MAAPAEHPRARLLPALGWAIVVVALLFFSLRDWSSFQFGSWTDDAKYVLLSRAIVQGEPYRIIYGPEPEVSSFPFLLPLALTPFTVLAPDSLDAGKLVSLLATLTSITALFWGWPLLSGLRSRWWALAAAALYGLSPQIVGMSHMIMGEPLLTTFVLLGSIAGEHAARGAPSTRGRYVLAGFLAACAFYTRTAGVAVGAALGVRILWQRRRDSARPLTAALLGVLLLVVPVTTLTSISLDDLVPWLYVRTVPHAIDASGAGSPLAQQVADSVRDYAYRSLREGLVPVGGSEREHRLGERIGLPELSTALSLILTGLVLAGAAWSSFGALRPSVLLFELFYVVVILLWHVRGWRLLLPAFPFLVLQLVWGARIAAEGFARAVRLAAERRQILANGVAAAAVVFLIAASLYRVVPRGPTSLTFVRDLREGTTWLRQRSEPDALVVAAEPSSVHVYSKRPIVPIAENLTSDELWRLTRRTQARYLLIAPALLWNDDGILRYDETTLALLPSIEAASARGELELVYESEPAQMVRVYRLATAVRPGV